MQVQAIYTIYSMLHPLMILRNILEITNPSPPHAYGGSTSLCFQVTGKYLSRAGPFTFDSNIRVWNRTRNGKGRKVEPKPPLLFCSPLPFQNTICFRALRAESENLPHGIQQMVIPPVPVGTTDGIPISCVVK